jgi:hypothetical protein
VSRRRLWTAKGSMSCCASPSTGLSILLALSMHFIWEKNREKNLWILSVNNTVCLARRIVNSTSVFHSLVPCCAFTVKQHNSIDVL